MVNSGLFLPTRTRSLPLPVLIPLRDLFIRLYVRSRTLQYEQYINSDNTECLVFERYRDSQAVLIITRIWGTQRPRFFRLALRLEKYAGKPGRELIEQLKGSPVQVYTPFLAN